MLQLLAVLNITQGYMYMIIYMCNKIQTINIGLNFVLLNYTFINLHNKVLHHVILHFILLHERWFGMNEKEKHFQFLLLGLCVWWRKGLKQKKRNQVLHVEMCVCVCVMRHKSLASNKENRCSNTTLEFTKIQCNQTNISATPGTFYRRSIIKISLYILPAFQDLYSFSQFYKMPIYFKKSLQCPDWFICGTLTVKKVGIFPRK